MRNTFYTASDIRGLMEGVTYLPGWTFEVYETEFQGPAIAINARVPDAHNSGQEIDLRIKSFVPGMILNEQHFFAWLRWRLESIAIHEVHEWLQLHGTPIFDPHDEGADEPAPRTL